MAAPALSRPPDSRGYHRRTQRRVAASQRGGRVCCVGTGGGPRRRTWRWRRCGSGVVAKGAPRPNPKATEGCQLPGVVSAPQFFAGRPGGRFRRRRTNEEEPPPHGSAAIPHTGGHARAAAAGSPPQGPLGNPMLPPALFRRNGAAARAAVVQKISCPRGRPCSLLSRPPPKNLPAVHAGCCPRYVRQGSSRLSLVFFSRGKLPLDGTGKLDTRDALHRPPRFEWEREREGRSFPCVALRCVAAHINSTPHHPRPPPFACPVCPFRNVP
jgi:hypothetical protein